MWRHSVNDDAYYLRREADQSSFNLGKCISQMIKQLLKYLYILVFIKLVLVFRACFKFVGSSFSNEDPIFVLRFFFLYKGLRFQNYKIQTWCSDFQFEILRNLWFFTGDFVYATSAKLNVIAKQHFHALKITEL